MKHKLLWITTITLLVIHLLIQYIFIHPYNLSDSIAIVSFVVDLFSNIILVTIIGAILGALTALVPSQEKTYKERFSSTFPKSTSLVLIIFIGASILIYYIMSFNR